MKALGIVKVLQTLFKENIYLSVFIRIERVVGKSTRRVRENIGRVRN